MKVDTPSTLLASMLISPLQVIVQPHIRSELTRMAGVRDRLPLLCVEPHAFSDLLFTVFCNTVIQLINDK